MDRRTGGEDVVRVGLEGDRHEGVLVREQAAVAVTEVEAPDLEVLVRAAAHQQCAVRRDVHRQDLRRRTRSASIGHLDAFRVKAS